MCIEPVFEDWYRAGGRGRGGDEGGKLGEDGTPVCFGPVGSRVRRAESGGGERNNNGNVVGACGLKRCVPPADSGGEEGVGEGQVKDRRPGRVCEWEVGIDSGLVKKGEASFRCEGKIGVRNAHFSRVVDPERVGGGVVNVEVS